MKTKETLKTVLICVLLLGTVYLTYAVWFFDNPYEFDPIKSLFDFNNSEISSELGKDSDTSRYGIRPMMIAVRDENGLRASVYNGKETDEIYGKLRSEIGKALSDELKLERISKSEWNGTLLEKGVLLDYYGDVPLDSIRLWHGSKDRGNAIAARYYFFSTDENQISVYMKDSKGENIYAAKTDVKSKVMTERISMTGGVPASLAAEQPETYPALLPESVIPEKWENPSEITVYNSIEIFPQEITYVCIVGFGLEDAALNTYSEQNGTSVYVADMITLKLLKNGTVSYTDTRDKADETLGISVETEKQTPTLAEKTETAHTLASSFAARLSGDCGIYIMSISVHGEETEFIFGRHINGVPINESETSYFAKIIVRGKLVRDVEINLRAYNLGTGIYDIIPPKLAAAATVNNAASGDIIMRYDDADGTLAPKWFVGKLQKIS